jgi:dTDP-4-dehydrorhamnose reductase
LTVKGPTAVSQPIRTDGLAAWAGFECARVRVGRRVADQLELTGHHTRLQDIALLEGLGVSAVRYPLLWERIAPRGVRRIDWTWPDERLEALQRAGIRPIVGLLHHGGGPRGVSLLHPGFAAALARYAAAIARRYPWVDAYIPINEPLTTARFAGLYGYWHPHLSSDAALAEILLAQCLAIRAAIRAIREFNPAAQLIVNEDVGRTFGTPPMGEFVETLNTRRWLTWDLLAGRVTRGHPLATSLAASARAEAALASLAADPQPPDILGVDHYVTSDRYLDHRVRAYPPDVQPTDPRATWVDVEAVRVAGAPEAGVRAAIEDTWARYRLPIALTEVALAGPAGDQVAWWNESWRASLAARRRGIDVQAVTAWAVTGATDWHTLMRRSEGVYEPGCFDVRHSPPLERPLADAVRASARGQAPPEVAAGWWRRPDRAHFEPGGRRAA